MTQPYDGLRLSDADRQAAIDRLAEQYAVGRLTRDEFDERSDAVWTARTGGDLSPVFADLPSLTAERRPVPHAHAGVRRVVFPLLALLVVLTVVTHLPFLLVGLVLFLVLRGHRHRGRAWARHGGYAG